MSKKGATIFGDALMALIIGIVVIISIVVGVVIAWDNIVCYTGLKWMASTPLGPSVGTVANSKIIIDVDGPLITNYTYCSNVFCEDKYSEDDELKQECIDTICAKDYPKKTTDYIYFEITVKNRGVVPTGVVVSALQDNEEFWYKQIRQIDYQEESVITTPAADVVAGECELKFKADPLENLPSVEYEMSRKDFGYCINTQTVADKQTNRGLREDCIADCLNELNADINDCVAKYTDKTNRDNCIVLVRAAIDTNCIRPCIEEYP